MGGAARMALLGLVLLLAALLFDVEQLLAPGIALPLLAASAVAWVRLAARGLVVERALGARAVVEDEPLEARIAVHGAGAPLPGGELADPLLAAPAPLRPRGRGAAIRVHARFERRGRRVLAPPAAIVRDPFGLAAARVEGSARDELLVLPRTGPVTAPQAGAAAVRGTPGRGTAAALAAEIEIDGLRPHRPGTPASRIHWPALARGHGLLERRLREEADARPLIVLDPRAPVAEEDLDAAVRATASLCLALAPRGGCGLLLPGHRRATQLDAGLAGWPEVHARLALVGPEARAPAPIGPRAAAVIYVAARAPARLPPALARAPLDGRFLVVPRELAGRRPSFAVTGCLGYELAPARGGRRASAQAQEPA